MLTTAAAAPAADLEAGRRKAEPCGRCHGADGNATIAGTPSLAGQHAWFTHWTLFKFRDGRRKDPVMSPFAANLSDADLADLSEYYAAQRPRPRAQAVDAAKAAAGRELYKAQTAGDLEGLMTQAAQPLSDADIERLAHFIAGFGVRGP